MFQQQFHLMRFSNVFYSLSRFPLKQRDGGSSETVEVTVYNYYLKRRGGSSVGARGAQAPLPP